MNTLQEFTIVFDNDAMIQAMAAALTRTRIKMEAVINETDQKGGAAMKKA